MIPLAAAFVPAAAVHSATAVEGSTPQRVAARLTADQQAMASNRALADRLRASVPSGPAIEHLRIDLQADSAEYSFREAIRDEQANVYALARDSALEQQVIGLLPASRRAGVVEAVEAVRAVGRLSGIADLGQLRVRRSRRFADSEPIESLLGYYRAAAAQVGIDWTYLAAINYIESDFGRLNGPSSAGALGPMQFLPSTWREYGAGGDILSSRDSIEAAAKFLRRNGAPGDYDRALLAYNRDLDYVAAVQHFAGAVRSDNLWLTRLYYWSTFG